MGITIDMLERGYFPEILPPSFSSAQIAKFYKEFGNDNGIPENYQNVINSEMNEERWHLPIIFNAINVSNTSQARREFMIFHPSIYSRISLFMEDNWDEICQKFDSEISFSVPMYNPDNNNLRSFTYKSRDEFEVEKFIKIHEFKHIFYIDISRFYHTIYTHAISWAFYEKEDMKSGLGKDQGLIHDLVKLDILSQYGQDGQTLGIPVGPDSSKIISELIGAAIDKFFIRNAEESKITDYQIVRHVDDIWIAANSLDEANKLQSFYRQSIREFQLDVNEHRSGIIKNKYSNLDEQKQIIISKFKELDNKINIEKELFLINIFNYIINLGENENIDNIIKYSSILISKIAFTDRIWEIIESFLKGFIYAGASSKKKFDFLKKRACNCN